MFSHFDPIVFTSEDSWPEHIFTGYIFVGPHIVIGEEGYAEYLRNNQAPPPQQDGCYFLITTNNDKLAFSADYKGYAKIFVYNSGRRWAVSNSFAELVDAVRGRGWTITPNEHSLPMWSHAHSFWQQLTTFETAAREIRLLPRRSILTVDRRGKLQEKTGTQSPPQANPTEYSISLGNFLDTWVGRMASVLGSPTATLVTELSGGLDSRVTMSLILGLRQFFALGLSDRLEIRSSRRLPIDLERAQQITDTYHLNLNVPPTQPKFGLDYIPPYERWRQFSLGSYGPLYWPAASYRVGSFHVGGHGGEGHRAVWSNDSPHRFLNGIKDSFLSKALFRSARRAFDETRELLSRSYPGLPLSLAHYQEFRDRLHSGLHAQGSVRLQPLASRFLYEVASHAGSGAISRGQILYDVMFQLAPSLSMLPYDTSSKTPSTEIIRHATAPIALAPIQGKVFGLDQSLQDRRTVSVGPWERLESEFEEATSRVPEGLVGSDVIERARRALQDAKLHGRLDHATSGAPIHHVLLADLVSR